MRVHELSHRSGICLPTECCQMNMKWKEELYDFLFLWILMPHWKSYLPQACPAENFPMHFLLVSLNILNSFVFPYWKTDWFFWCMCWHHPKYSALEFILSSYQSPRPLEWQCNALLTFFFNYLLAISITFSCIFITFQVLEHKSTYLHMRNILYQLITVCP